MFHQGYRTLNSYYYTCASLLEYIAITGVLAFFPRTAGLLDVPIMSFVSNNLPRYGIQLILQPLQHLMPIPLVDPLAIDAVISHRPTTAARAHRQRPQIFA